MELKLVACLFTGLQTLMLAGQITTLVSTYWTSWDLRFNWTRGMHFTKLEADGQLVSQGHAGLWSRCVRVYDLSREDAQSVPYTCLNNYNTSNGSLHFSYGKACKTATAALCIGDTSIIVSIVVIGLVCAFKSRGSQTLTKLTLPLLLFEGLLCFSIPLLYLSGNMAELIDQLSGAYGLLLVVQMTPWYTHDWAFWTQVGLLVIWSATVGVFVRLYSIKYAQNYPKGVKGSNCKEAGDSTELETLRN